MFRFSLPVQFLLLLLIALSFSFGVHVFVLSIMGLPIFENLIVLSYVVNGILAAGIFITLYRFREKLKNQIGFLFLAGSFLKFAIFFILFYPTYRSDGEMSGLEFGAFFIPYAIGLFLETFFMSRMLKNL